MISEFNTPFVRSIDRDGDARKVRIKGKEYWRTPGGGLMLAQAGASFPDIYEQTTITQVIKREWEELAKQPGGGIDTGFQASTILGKVPLNGRRVKIRIQDILPMGMANFRAEHGTPSLWTPRPRLREEVIGIVDIDEVSRIDEVKLLALESQDPNVFRDALIDIQDLGVYLQQRNELRVEWMRWQCLQGALVIPFPNAGSVTINYGIPSTHFPTFSVPWATIATADPINDLWSLGAVALDDSGIYLPNHHMNDATWRTLRRATTLRNQLSTYGRTVMLPTMEDVGQLLRTNDSITIVDAGFMLDTATTKRLTKWIPDGKIFTTTRGYTYGGRPLGDMADGWVLIKQPGTERPVARQGMQSEIKSTDMPPYQTYLRQVSSNLPRLYAPEAIAWGDAGPALP